MSRCAGRLEEAGLMVAASHVHTSPNTDRSKIGFSKVDCGYVAWAEEVIASGVDEILRIREWRKANLRFSTTACDCAMHRRVKVWSLGRSGIQRGFSIFPNATGPRDHDLRLLRVEDQDRSLLAAMRGVSYREISSDFPGEIRKHPTGWYHGASLTAFTRLCVGYELLAVSSVGANAIFIRGDLAVLGARPEDLYRENFLRNQWTSKSAAEQWTDICDLPYIDVGTIK